MTKIAIVQSNYIPWKGYFDLIAAVDEFILFDDMQYTRRDWRNRNQIKTPAGLQWLTVPVLAKGKFHQKICETEIVGSKWQLNHWKSLMQNYCKAPYFDDIGSWLEPMYTQNKYTNLSQLNRTFLEAICSYLGITTTLTNSWDYQLVDGKSRRLADLCRQAGGTEYVSGPSAKGYLDEEEFEKSGIGVSWFQYGNYKTYDQLWGKFTHNVTILDLLFNCGRDARKFLERVKQ